MSYADNAKQLKKNIQIMTKTFEKNNLQVLNIACKPYGENDGDLALYVELSTIEGDSIEEDVELKLNLYDSEGALYTNGCLSETIYEDEFCDYDTIIMHCYDEGHILDNAKKGRLFASRIY